MSSLIFKEFEEYGRIPNVEDVAYQVTKQIYGLDFANTFMKKGKGAKNLIQHLNEEYSEDLNDLQRGTIKDAVTQELITLHCKKLGSSEFKYITSFDSMDLPHQNIDAFSFLYIPKDFRLNSDRNDFLTKDHEAQAFYLMDDLDEIWKLIYRDNFTFGFIKKDTEILKSLVRFLVNEVRTGLSKQISQNETKFQKGENKSFNPFYEKIMRQIISVLFEQHKTYYKRYLSDIQIGYLFNNHRFTKVNSTLGIIEISKLIANYSMLHGGRPREVFKILTNLNIQDVKTRSPMDLRKIQNKILYSMQDGVN